MTRFALVGLACALAACSGPMAGTVADERPHLGFGFSCDRTTRALQGDETESLAAGETFDMQTASVRATLDLPIARSRYAGLWLRLSPGLRFTYGHLEAVTLRRLEDVAPGLSDLIVETAESFDSFRPGLTEQGADAFDRHLADRLDLADVGVDLSLSIAATGPRYALDETSYLEVAEIGIGGFFHLSGMRLTLTEEEESDSETFFGLGFGLQLRVVPITLRLDSLGGARVQLVAAEVEIFGLATRGNLRAIVFSSAVGTQIVWPL